MSAQGLPPHLLALFAPRPPLPHAAPLRPLNVRGAEFGDLARFLTYLDPQPPPPEPPGPKPESQKERKARLKRERLDEHRRQQKKAIAAYDPSVGCATKNPFATLFVAKLSYETTEKKLSREFERYGAIRRVRIVTDPETGKSRGYAFIEYELEDDMRRAYKRADGTKIDGRRVLVDVERSRTVPNWVPRRLGGGKGPPRFQESKAKQREAAIARALAAAAAATSVPSPRQRGTGPPPRGPGPPPGRGFPSLGGSGRQGPYGGSREFPPPGNFNDDPNRTALGPPGHQARMPHGDGSRLGGPGSYDRRPSRGGPGSPYGGPPDRAPLPPAQRWNR